MDEIGFHDRVAVVTGAGGSLGRAHARLLASRGARIVANDIRVDDSDEPGPADKLVEAIRQDGGQAIVSYHRVDDPEGASAVIESALEQFGGIDIVINNAGILRDSSFLKMSLKDWEDVVRVHLQGTMLVSKAAWPHLRERSYGRVVNTTSAAGLYGNFGQANYAAAKLGIVGLTKTLAQEGAKYNIRVNAIAPVAKSPMTESILPPEVLAKIEPEWVSPVMAYLCSERCADTGRILTVGGARVASVGFVEGRGVQWEAGCPSIEDVAHRWSDILNIDDGQAFSSALEAVTHLLS